MLKKSMFSFTIEKLLLSHLAIDKKTKVSLIDPISWLKQLFSFEVLFYLAFKSFRIQSTPLLH